MRDLSQALLDAGLKPSEPIVKVRRRYVRRDPEFSPQSASDAVIEQILGMDAQILGRSRRFKEALLVLLPERRKNTLTDEVL